MKKIISVLMCMVMILSYTTISFSVFASDYDNTLYVSPNGDDENSGAFGSPLLTLEGAKNVAKNLSGTTVVYFRQGNYTIDKTVNFTSDDKSNVTYKAYNNEKVVFTSGKAYTGFEECTVNGVNAFKKNVGTDADFNILFNETTTLSRTRYPETGYLLVTKVDQSETDASEDEEFHAHFSGFYGDSSQLMNFKNENDVVIRLLHFWKDEMLTIKDYDDTTGHITTSRPTTMRVKVNDRYFLENVFEALDKAGEWYLDKSEGILYYVPYEGEQAENLTLWGSETETMISVNGVDGINFENIIFRCNGFNIPHNNEGIDFSQAAYDATACVSYVSSNNNTIKNCEFRDLAGCAVFFGTAVKNSTVDSCIFNNIGAQAVYIRGENVQVDDPNVTKNITVSNNIIDGYGKVFFNAVGVLVIHANSVDITHNEIHDGYYTAISVGWVWGFDYSVTYNNKICDNLIYDIGQGWLSDMGGIYTLGIQEGTMISGNVIHNVAADPNEGGYGGWGIYLDEGSSKMLVEKNLVYCCGSDGYHLHYGAANTVRNNIFAFNGESQIRVTSALSRVSTMFGNKETANFTNNILLTDKKTCTFSHYDDKISFSNNNNTLWDMTYGSKLYVSDRSADSKSMSIKKAVKKGIINNPVIADPMFKDAYNYDFELDENSPAIASGFEVWDYSNAGTIKGSTVGLSTLGGQTAYNASSESVPLTKSKTPFEPFIAIANFFTNMFNKLFGWIGD